MKPYILILAAGKGTRMKSPLPKVLHEALGRPILSYVIEAAKATGSNRICSVIGHGADEVKQAFAGETEFALQLEQKGTGHAVMCGLSAFDGAEEGCVLVLCGDTPLLRGDTLKALCGFHQAEGAVVTVMTAEIDNPFGYGRIVRHTDGRLKAIVEQRDADEETQLIKEINSGVYCFDLAFLRSAVSELTTDNDQGELYLTDTVAIAGNHGLKAMAFKIDDADEVKGINDRDQLAEAEEILKQRI